MKSKLYLLPFVALAGALLGLTGLRPATAVTAGDEEVTAEEAAKTASNWDETRTNLSYTAEGIQLDQTEMGTPKNHAISILTVPFTDIDNFEINMTLKMDEFVEAGVGGNDVWCGLGVMGVPKFINWQNNEKDGLARDTPGIFYRFFNIGGDLRYEGSIYQADYAVDGPNGTHKEDAWQLIYGSGNCDALKAFTCRMTWEADERNKTPHYNIYLNDNLLTPNGEADFLDRSVMLPESKIYLVLVMNTQKDDLNELSRIVVHSINGTSYVDPSAAASSETPDSEPGATESQPDVETESGGGCGGAILSTSLVAAALCGAAVVGAIGYRRKHIKK